MELTLDGERLPLAPAENTITAALRIGVDTAASRSRMIIEVIVDGRPLDKAKMDSDVAAKVELRTAHPGELVRDTLLQAAESLDTVRAQQQACGEAFAKGDEPTAIDYLRVALEGWQMIRDVIEQTRQLVGDKWTDVVVSGIHGEATLDHAVGQLAIALKAIKATSETQDWSALADIIMYDMDVLADIFTGLLKALAERSYQP